MQGHHLARSLSALFLVTAPAGMAFAQVERPAEATKTKLESFVAQDGVVFVTGFAKMGIVKCQYSATVAVDARESTNAASGKREFGLAVEVRDGERPETRRTSHVDFDEIPSLLQGLDYVVKVTKAATTLDDFQADLKTRGDLRVSVFSSSNAEAPRVSVTSGNIRQAQAFCSLAELAQFRGLIQAANDRLAKIREASK